MGAIYRWSENGRIASCVIGNCRTLIDNGLTTEEELKERNSGYMFATGKFMNVMLIIYSVLIGLPCACCLLCLPIVICCVVAKKD